MKKLLISFFLVAGIAACSETSHDQKAEEAPVKKEKANSPQLREYSELALTMRDMFDRLELVKGHIAKGEAIPDSLQLDFSTIHSDQRTEGMGEGNAFEGYATLFLNSVDTLAANQDVETFNLMVNACVDCHTKYCTGVVRKIKKLEI